MYMNTSSLYNIMHQPHHHVLLPRQRRVLQRIEIECPHTRQQIHLALPDEEATLVPTEDLPEYEEGDHDGCGKVCLEEGLGVGASTGGLLG